MYMFWVYCVGLLPGNGAYSVCPMTSSFAGEDQHLLS